MADTFTTRMGLIMQAYGGNPETWGTELNNAVIALVDDAIAYDPIAVNSDVTLSADDGLENQARRYLLVFTGDGGHTVTVKDVDRWYLVYNKCSADVTIKPDAGTGSDVRAGTCALWITNGTTSETVDVSLDKIAKPLANVDFNGKKIVNAGKGADPTDVATLSNEFKDFAKPSAALDINGQKLTNLGSASAPGDAAPLSTPLNKFGAPDAAISMGGQRVTNVAPPQDGADAATRSFVQSEIAVAATINLPSVTGQDGKVLTNDGTVAFWGRLNPVLVTADTGLAAGGNYRITATVPVTLTLPASPDAGDSIHITDGESISPAVHHIVDRNGATIRGQSENLTLDVPGISLTLWYSGTDWRLF